MRKNASLKRAAIFGVILILVLVAMIGGLRMWESTVSYSGDEAPIASKTIIRDGAAYFPRQDITVILAMGIDETGPVQSSGSYRNYGESDAVILLILDHTNENYRILCLNRDTMVHMPVLGLGGKRAGTLYGQLALSHTYGEGLEDSCENTRTTVSDMLNGITIDHYVAMNIDAIAIVNDAVGGVTVNVTDDFSIVDEAIPMGSVTLKGRQALSFVQTRMGVGNQLNISRMGRHTEYMKGLMRALTQKIQESDTFTMNLYDQMSEYVVSDCSVTVISSLLKRCGEYTLEEILTPEGTNVLGEEYYEFYVDEDKLDDLVLRLFYAKKK